MTARRSVEQLLLAIVIFACSVWTASARPDTRCFEAWWTGHVEAIEKQRRGAEALLPLRKLDPLIRTAADPHAVAAALDAVVNRSGTSPLVAAEIDQRLLAFDLDRSAFDAARARVERLGMVTEFAVGPIDSAPEDVSETIATWRRLPVEANGVLTLSAVFPPAERVSAPVAFYVHAERKASVALRYGADDYATLEVDGTAIDVPTAPHDLRFDQHAVFLELSAGWHRFVLRAHQQLDGWSIVARLTDPDGGPADRAISVRWPDDLAAAEREIAAQGRPKTIQGHTLTAELERRARRGGEAKAHLALDLSQRQPEGRQSPRPGTLARQAAAQRASDEVLWVQALIEDDASTRRDLFETLLVRNPDEIGARRQLIFHYFGVGQRRKALELMRAASRRCPEEDPFLATWTASGENLPGFPLGALARLRELSTKYPRAPFVWQRLAAVAGSVRMENEARQALSRYLDLRGTDAPARQQLLQMVTRAGQTERLDELLDVAETIQPLHAAWPGYRARTLMADGDYDAAREVLERALEIAPDEPSLLEQFAEAALFVGDEDAAIAAWQKRLRSGEPSAELEKRLARLSGNGGAFGDQWTMSLEQAREILARHEASIEGDPAYVNVARTVAYKLQANGLSEQMQQQFFYVRKPDQAGSLRTHPITYSPGLQSVSVYEARLIRKDGTVLPASRSDRALLPDLELRMWYDTRTTTIGFPRLEEGDWLEIRFSTRDRGPNNSIGKGYFGDVLLLGQPVPGLQTRVVIESPESLPVRHALNNAPPDVADAVVVTRTVDGGVARLVLDVPPLPGFPRPSMSPPASETLPYVLLSSMESWEQMGSVYADLIREQLTITPDAQEIVRELQKTATSRSDLIEKLYHWVIENTRYVALELGIHALKPYDIGTVMQRRHGDCKDKAALLVSMLDEAGIEANIALVRTQPQGKIDTSVPTLSIFDHAIVHVPKENLWLDGTVLHHGAQELPLGDRDTLALLIDLEGPGSGTLVKTPDAEPENASIERKDNVSVNAEGDADFESFVTARGEMAAIERAYLRLADDRDNVLGHRLRSVHPGSMVLLSSFDAIELGQQLVRYSYHGHVPSLGRRVGNQITLPLALEPPTLDLPAPDPGRTEPIDLPTPFHERAVTRFSLDSAASVVELPQQATLESAWGRVHVEAKRVGKQIEIVTETEFRGGRIEREQIADFSRFVESARQALEQRLVIAWP